MDSGGSQPLKKSENEKLSNDGVNEHQFTDNDGQSPNEDIYKLPQHICLKIQRANVGTCDGQSQEEGVIFFEGGHVYKGMLSKGLMDGFGILTQANGLKYEGEFSRNMPMGWGTYTWSDGSTYSGQVYRCKRHGTGTYTCPKHLLYSGQWYWGKRHGEGTEFYNEDKTSWYKGHWVMNRKEGSGVRCYSSGNIYSGEWKNSRRHGRGTMSWVKLGQQYDGLWQNGAQHGSGKHTWLLKSADGSWFLWNNQYQGDFSEGQRHGRGTFYFAGGAVYTGEWKNNRKHGQGEISSPDGCVFEVEMLDDHVTMKGEAAKTLAVFSLLESNPSKSISLSIKSVLNKIPPKNQEMERKQVEFVVHSREIELKLIYSFYRRLGHPESPDNTFLLSRLQFWRLLKDCNIQRHGLTLTQIESFIREDASSKEIHCPFTSMLPHELLGSLVVVAYHVYSNDIRTEKHILASCLSKLLTEDILPNARKVKGFLFKQPDVAVEALKYKKRCWEVFEALCGLYTAHRKEETMTFRQLMWMFKDHGLFDHQLTTTKLVEVMMAESCDVCNHSSCLEMKIQFLEFFEVLLGCVKIKGEQVLDGVEETFVLLQAHKLTRENLPSAGNTTAQDVENVQELQSHDQTFAGNTETGNNVEKIRIHQFFEYWFLPAVEHLRMVKMFTHEAQDSKKPVSAESVC